MEDSSFKRLALCFASVLCWVPDSLPLRCALLHASGKRGRVSYARTSVLFPGWVERSGTRSGTQRMRCREAALHFSVLRQVFPGHDDTRVSTSLNVSANRMASQQKPAAMASRI